MYTQAEIDRSFKTLESDIKKRSKKDGTNEYDVLGYMYEHPEKIWHMSWEFINQVTKEGRFLSHRSPARASYLAIHKPHIVEDRKIGRFSAYRLRWENLEVIKKALGVTHDPGEEREEINLQSTEDKCEHGLPRFVSCPSCKK